MAKTAKLIGFDGVDLTVRTGEHVLPENVEKDLPEAINAVRKEGLIADTITTAITSADDPESEKIIKVASSLGIKQYRMGWYIYDNNLDMEKNLEKITLKFKKLADLNKRYSIRGDYQNHSGQGFGATLWDIYQVYKEIGSEWLGISYDIRHATVEGGLSWSRTFQLVQPYIRSLDIKDFTWSYDNTNNEYIIKNVPLGEGMVDFKTFFNLINRYALRCDHTLHLEYDLGGANEGSSILKISKDKFFEAFGKDLAFIKKYEL